MSLLNEFNAQTELKRWFAKSIIDFDFDLDTNYLLEALVIFKSDYLRYFPEDNDIILEKVRDRVELQGILLYRTARVYYLNKSNIIADKLSALGRFLSGFEIYYSAHIGYGLRINHGLGTVIGSRCIIGSNALIHQGVTIGDKNGGRPKIGDFVTIYAGAKVLGEIILGDHVVIGANAVLLNNVPLNGVAVGNPAKLLSKK